MNDFIDKNREKIFITISVLVLTYFFFKILINFINNNFRNKRIEILEMNEENLNKLNDYYSNKINDEDTKNSNYEKISNIYIDKEKKKKKLKKKSLRKKNKLKKILDNESDSNIVKLFDDLNERKNKNKAENIKEEIKMPTQKIVIPKVQTPEIKIQKKLSLFDKVKNLIN